MSSSYRRDMDRDRRYYSQSRRTSRPTERPRDTSTRTYSPSPERRFSGYSHTRRPRFESSRPQTPPPRSRSRGRRRSPPPRPLRRDGRPRRFVPSEIHSDSDSDAPSPPRLGGRRRNSFTVPAFLLEGRNFERFQQDTVLPELYRWRQDRELRTSRRAENYYEVPQRRRSPSRDPQPAAWTWRHGGDAFANILPSQAAMYRVHDDYRSRSPGDRRPSYT